MLLHQELSGSESNVPSNKQKIAIAFLSCHESLYKSGVRDLQLCYG